MGLSDLTTIDLKLVDAKGHLVLVVTDDGLLGGQERDTAFREKIKAYEAYLNGQFSEDHPDVLADEVYVQLVCAVEPSAKMDAMVSAGIVLNDGTRSEICVQHLPSRY